MVIMHMIHGASMVATIITLAVLMAIIAGLTAVRFFRTSSPNADLMADLLQDPDDKA